MFIRTLPEPERTPTLAFSLTTPCVYEVKIADYVADHKGVPGLWTDYRLTVQHPKDLRAFQARMLLFETDGVPRQYPATANWTVPEQRHQQLGVAVAPDTRPGARSVAADGRQRVERGGPTSRDPSR